MEWDFLYGLTILLKLNYITCKEVAPTDRVPLTMTFHTSVTSFKQHQSLRLKLRNSHFGAGQCLGFGVGSPSPTFILWTGLYPTPSVCERGTAALIIGMTVHKLIGPIPEIPFITVT